MASSLSELCSRPDVASFVLQGDRRQIADRRKVRRGGRRASDSEPAIDLDLRDIALRRALSTPRLERPEARPARDADPQRHRFMMAAVRPFAE